MYINNIKIFSVVIPYFNSSNYLSIIERSLAANKDCIGEVIVVDDGSSEGELKILEEVRNRNAWKLIKLTMNKGPSFARNIGAASARCEYIAFLDADDAWDSSRLKYLQDVLVNNPHISFLVNKYSEKKASNLLINKQLKIIKLSKFSLLIRNYLQPSCFIAKRSIFIKFNENMRYSEDFDLQLQISAVGKSLYLTPYSLTHLGRPQGSSGGLSSQLFNMRLGEMHAYMHYFLVTNQLYYAPLLLIWSLVKHIWRGVKFWIK